MPGTAGVEPEPAMARLGRRLRDWERGTRPSNPDTRAALQQRWDGLPATARTPEQVLGRVAVGCEGTHGVFPRCNLTCSPCYHSADANKVRVDGSHTLDQVTAQMSLFRVLRGPRAHAQLIGGEVSLLDPDDHAAALIAMRAAGREPMSMSHGDFDQDYLERLVTDANGALRLRRVSFAAHFDSLMRGRRGVVRPRCEADLDEHRRAFVAMFAELGRRLGLRSYLAHNMTVTADNLDQVADVVRAVRGMGYQLMSFQPAALVGDERRWPSGRQGVTIEDVWAQLERGMGQPLAWQALSVGDPRCNRTAFGFVVGERWVPVLDPASPSDLAARDLCLRHYGGLGLDASRPGTVLVRLVRAAARQPGHLVVAAAWSRRAARRAGGVRHLLHSAVRGRVRGLTLVVHAFMDADVVNPAWELMGAGEVADEPRVREAQERLAACSYHMAHPETGELVPACVQHSVLDPGENKDLAVMLPFPSRRTA